MIEGGPGSGKGTQCQQIADECGFVHFSVGQMLRDELSKDSDIGKEAKMAMEEGKLVPVEVTLMMVKNAMEKSANKRFLIDGFPRAVDQAKAFEEKICKPDMVLYLECDSKVMEERILLRGKTSGRIDDNVETIKKRLKTFEEETLPVIQYYDDPDKDVLIKVNGARPSAEVFSGIASSLKELFSFESASSMVHKRHDCNNTTIVFILGGPGSGKGTQCTRMVRDLGFTHISIGDLLRNEAKSGSAIGKEVETIMQEGQLVPLDITMTLLQNAMSSATCRHIVLDGFPRSLDQAQAFEDKMGKPSLVLYLKCSLETMEKRLIKRGETLGRSDDNIETIRKRLESFEKQSKPVIEHYQSLVKEISTEKDVDTTYKEVKDTLLNTVEKPLAP